MTTNTNSTPESVLFVWDSGEGVHFFVIPVTEQDLDLESINGLIVNSDEFTDEQWTTIDIIQARIDTSELGDLDDWLIEMGVDVSEHRKWAQYATQGGETPLNVTRLYHSGFAL